MRIMILGGDGYLGWPTAMYLSSKGHEVCVVDNMIKRYWEHELGVQPLFQVFPLHQRAAEWKKLTGVNISIEVGDITHNHRFLQKAFDTFKPESVVHYAEQPSAPFSMMDREKCVSTQVNNIVGTLNLMFTIQRSNPDIHIVKLGTMGEYGQPNIDIEEGWLNVTHNGRSDRVLFPKMPGSFYHLSKVADSYNLEFATRIWGLAVTDLNQGVVYGTETDESEMSPVIGTSFHYDSTFGTVLNRFIVQAISGRELTVYGNGTQTRGYLNIKDTIRCVELAITNPAKPGEFRVFNQFTEQFSVGQLAEMVRVSAKNLGINVVVKSIPNPRVELENHYYNAKHSALEGLGLKPILLTEDRLTDMLRTAQTAANRVDPDVIMPVTKWNQRTK
ncbi:WcaG Nucleoside-diphosphate-sugar epimerases [Burkholderiales bacterium]